MGKLLTCCMAWVGAAPFATAATDSITFLPSGPLPKAAQVALADLAEPTDVQVVADSDPFVTVRAHCGGSFTNDYFELVKARNPTFVFGPGPAARRLSLPACAKVTSLTTAPVLANDSIATVTQRHFGVNPSAVIAPCEANSALTKHCAPTAAGQVARLNGGALSGLNKPLVEGRSLTLPWTTRPTTVRLKEGVSVEQAISTLTAFQKARQGAASSPTFGELRPSANLKLIQPLEGDNLVLSGTGCAPTEAPPEHWPFDREKVIEIVSKGRKLAAQRSILENTSVIRVADTGVSGLLTFFPKSSLSVNRYEKPDQTDDLDTNGYQGDYFGFDSDGSGSVSPYPDDIFRLHGTQVADVALGGHALRTAFPAIYDLLKLNVAKIFYKNGGRIDVRDSAFVSAIRAIPNQSMPRVVNFSVGAESQNNTRLFQQSLQAAEQLNFLAIVAAGNSHKDIGLGTPTYPASYSGSGAESHWIMTVGASDPQGQPTPFTNYSRTRVDILAPGCRIPFTSESGEAFSLNGTSMAAPLVSFTAGLIHALGVSRMSDVKTRIIASADYRPRLEKVTRFGGVVLNVERALSLYQDSLRVRGATADQRGKWVHADDELSLCEQDVRIDPARLLVLSASTEADVTTLRYIQRENDGSLSEPETCKAGPGGVGFIGDDGTEKTIAWAELDVLVPAYPFPVVREVGALAR